LNRLLVFFVLLGIPLPQGTAVGIHSQGKLFMMDRYAADLDEGDQWIQIDGYDDSYPNPPMSFKGSDFWYEWERKSEYLHPQHGARLARGGAAEAGFLGCSKAVYAKGAIRIDDLPVGSHICVHTNEGRFAEMRIEAFDKKEKTIWFTYTTWKKDDSDSTYQPH